MERDDAVAQFFNLPKIIKRKAFPNDKLFIPVIEAVTNAIEAHEEVGGTIRVEIHLLRPAQTALDKNAKNTVLNGIRVIDYGIGFNDDHFKSFRTLSSDRKEKLGCLGVGHYSYLKIFSKILVNSVYGRDGKKLHRNFRFEAPGEIRGLNDKPEELGKASTRIEFSNPVNPLEKIKSFPKTCESFKNEILENLLYKLHKRKIYSIEIIDEENNESEKITELPDGENTRFNLHGRTFEMTLFKTRLGSKSDVFLCASERPVKSILSKTDFKGIDKLEDDGGNVFRFHCYISSELLNENVNDERTGFNILEGGNVFGEISEEEISDRVNLALKEQLEPYLKKRKEQKEAKIRKVTGENPEYAVTMKQYPDIAESFGFSDTEDSIANKIEKGYFKKRKESREKLNRAAENKKSEPYWEYMEKTMEAMREYDQTKKIELAAYVSYRMKILDVFHSAISQDEDDNYGLEKEIHNLVFPMGTSSQDSKRFYKDHNLWIIDDRYSFFDYAFSDMRLEKHLNIASDSKSRPDIALEFQRISKEMEHEGDFYKMGYLENMERDAQSIVIFEFKKPGLEKNRKDDDPVLQCIEYMQMIKAGKVKYHDGTTIIHNENSLNFFVHIICKFSEKIIEKIKIYSFLKKTFDGQGYYGWDDNRRAYFEIREPEKVLRDANQRNEAFFRYLGLK